MGKHHRFSTSAERGKFSGLRVHTRPLHGFRKGDTLFNPSRIYFLSVMQTFSVIAFTLSLCTSPSLRDIRSPSTDRSKIFTVLVVAPKNTISNWKDEYNRWMPLEYKDQVRVRLMDSTVGLNKKKQGI